jgi:hypothetical protein
MDRGGERPTWPKAGIARIIRCGLATDSISAAGRPIAVVDVSDITRPRTIARMPSDFRVSTHTVVPLRQAGSDRDFVVVVDEGWNDANEAIRASGSPTSLIRRIASRSRCSGR